MIKQKSILVVEDDRFLSDIYKRQLQAKGCSVAVGVNGMEGLALLEETKPDLILLDLIMPGMDGFDFLEAMRALPTHKKRRVIVLTNLGQESDKERCRALGVTSVLFKPVTPPEFHRAVQSVLGEHANHA